MNITTLLDKKAWTGEEVGKALIAALAYDIQHKGKKYKPLLQQSDFDIMLKSLNTQKQFESYLMYERIYNGVFSYYNKGQAMYQQFLHGYYRYLFRLQQIQQAEQVLKVQEWQTLVISQAQYDEIFKTQSSVLESRESTFYSVLYEFLRWCMDNETLAPDSVKKALSECRHEQATRIQNIISYCKENGIGCYQLEDGTTSITHTPKSWEQALEKAWIGKNEHLRNQVQENGIKTVIRAYKTEQVIELVEMLFRDDAASKTYFEKITKNTTIDDILELRIESMRQSRLDSSDAAHWIPLEIPKNASKYDIISSPDLLLYYFKRKNIGIDVQAKEFELDYPTLYSALKEELTRKLNIKKIGMGKRYKWGELAKLDIANYPLYIHPSDRDIISGYLSGERGRKAFSYKGIAILSGHDKVNYETSDRITIENLYAALGALDHITVEESCEIKGYLDILIAPAVKQMLAFNKLIDILSETYGIPDLLFAKQDLGLYGNKIDTFNTLLYNTYINMAGSREERKRKRKLLKSYFRPIHMEIFEPKSGNIEIVEKKIRKDKHSGKLSSDLDKYIDILLKGNT